MYTVTSRLGVSNANWLDGLPTLAVEFWLQVASGGNGGSDRTIFRAGGTLSSGGTRRIVIRNDETADVGTATETLSFLTRHADGTERITCLATNLQDESRHHWVFSVTAGTHKIWRDSATLAASAQSGTATGNLQVLSDAATIGDPSILANEAIPGTYGRIIFWPFVPSDQWVLASYRNQNDPADFMGIGALDEATVANLSPVAVPIYATAEVSGTGTGSPSVVNVITPAIHPDSGTITCTAAGPAPNGSVSRTTTTVTYTPSTSTAAVYRVPYTISDGSKVSRSRILYDTAVGQFLALPFGWWNRFKNSKGYGKYSGQRFYSGVMSMNWTGSSQQWNNNNGNPSAKPPTRPTTGIWNQFTGHMPEAVGGNLGATVSGLSLIHI